MISLVFDSCLLQSWSCTERSEGAQNNQNASCDERHRQNVRSYGCNLCYLGYFVIFENLARVNNYYREVQDCKCSCHHEAHRKLEVQYRKRVIFLLSLEPLDGGKTNCKHE